MSSRIDNYSQESKIDNSPTDSPTDWPSSSGSKETATFGACRSYNDISHVQNGMFEESLLSRIKRRRPEPLWQPTACPRPSARAQAQRPIMSIKDRIAADDEIFMPFIANEHEQWSHRGGDIPLRYHDQNSRNGASMTHLGSPAPSENEYNPCYIHEDTTCVPSNHHTFQSEETTTRMRQSYRQGKIPSYSMPYDRHYSAPLAAPLAAHHHHHFQYHMYGPSFPQPHIEGQWHIPAPPPAPSMAAPIPRHILLPPQPVPPRIPHPAQTPNGDIHSSEGKPPPFVELYQPSRPIHALRPTVVSYRPPSPGNVFYARIKRMLMIDESRPCARQQKVVLGLSTSFVGIQFSFQGYDDRNPLPQPIFLSTRSHDDVVELSSNRSTGIPFRRGRSVIGRRIIAQTDVQGFDPTIRRPSSRKHIVLPPSSSDGEDEEGNSGCPVFGVPHLYSFAK